MEHDQRNVMKAPSKNRLSDIDRAKGLAIFLVVFGHIVARPPIPLGADWYFYLKEVIYSFHMPFFIFLSGVLFFYTFKPIVSFQSYLIYIGRRFLRLMPAYILFALLIWVGKYLAGKFTHIDNPVQGFDDFYNLFLYPRLNYVSFLWYIYIIFLMNILVPVLLYLCRYKLSFLFLISAALPFIPTTPIGGINVLFDYLVFFVLGGCIINNYIRYTFFIDRWFWVFISLFLSALYLADTKQMWILLSLLSIPALHGLVRRPLLEKCNFLSCWGNYTFSIYLMNTMAIELCKLIITYWLDWDGNNFYWISLLLLLSGLLLPIFIKQKVISKIKWLDKITM